MAANSKEQTEVLVAILGALSNPKVALPDCGQSCAIETCIHALFGIALTIDNEVEEDVPDEYKNIDEEDVKETKKETKNGN